MGKVASRVLPAENQKESPTQHPMLTQHHKNGTQTESRKGLKSRLYTIRTLAGSARREEAGEFLQTSGTAAMASPTSSAVAAAGAAYVIPGTQAAPKLKREPPMRDPEEEECVNRLQKMMKLACGPKSAQERFSKLRDLMDEYEWQDVMVLDTGNIPKQEEIVAEGPLPFGRVCCSFVMLWTHATASQKAVSLVCRITGRIAADPRTVGINLEAEGGGFGKACLQEQGLTASPGSLWTHVFQHQ